MSPPADDGRVLRRAPALAGGRLELLNDVLWFGFQPGSRDTERDIILEFDDGCSRVRDRDLFVLTARGDPARLPGPENGRIDAAHRAALRAAVRDRLPPTATLDATLDRLLPEADTPPVEAAVRLWSGLVEGLGVPVRGAAAPSDEPPTALERPRITWVGPRHEALLAELGRSPGDFRAGEKAFRTRKEPDTHPEEESALGSALREGREELEARLARLEAAVRSEEPRLLGAWALLRRQTRRALDDFGRRAERTSRNRSGTQGARLHALAQGLRPGDGPQESGLGLVTAAASFGLDLSDLERYRPAFEAARGREEVFVSIETGALLDGGLEKATS